jgi:hypothetical protein
MAVIDGVQSGGMAGNLIQDPRQAIDRDPGFDDGWCCVAADKSVRLSGAIPWVQSVFGIVAVRTPANGRQRPNDKLQSAQ